MNLRKAITLVVTGAFLLTSALFAEEIKGDRQAGKTGPSRLFKGDDGPKSTFFNSDDSPRIDVYCCLLDR